MDPERFHRIEALFHRALELPAAERAGFLARECGGDGELAREVGRLLEADVRAAEGIERLELFEGGKDPLLGRQLGPWRILERLAEGGMGVVYRAERADRMFEQQVAVKMLRVEVATEDALRRFELERRLLAHLEHPNIARMLDAGRSELGTPYLVMEFVDGLPIDRWCEEHDLGLEARLRLFAVVCRTMHFAHMRLVVHRDLKPSNIMIDRHGQVKLLDFGIARLLEDDESLPTHTGARQLTPQYASPEQLQGLVLTTATDVYSLGVVLYELLTGRRPWRRTGRSPADWERIVSSEDPTRPSTAVQPRDAAQGTAAAAFAAHMGTSPARLQRRLRGDLDRIVLMALRKEPERRYASTEQIAEDLERYLADQPVRARRDTLGYRAQRFVKRNRLAVGAAALVLAALCGGLFAAWRGRLLAEAAAEFAQAEETRATQAAELAQAEKARATQAAELAQAEKARATLAAEHAEIEASSFQQIAEFFRDMLLRAADDDSRREMVAGMVELQAAQIRRQHAERPHLRANLLDALGQVYAQLELPDPAEALLREARTIRLATFGEATMEHALSLGSLGRLAYQRGAFAEAAEHLAAALELHRAIPDDVHSDVALAANDLAASLRRLGRLDEARALHEEALALRRGQDGGRSLPLAESLNNLAVVLLDQREPRAAREVLEEALAIREQILGSGHALTLQVLNALAGVAWQLGRPDAAESHLRAIVEGYRTLGEGGRDGLASALSNLSAMQIQRGGLDAAVSSAREALELTLGLDPDHPRTALARSRLAEIHSQRGEHEAARAEWLEVLRARRLVYPADHPILANTLNGLAIALVQAGSAAEAEPLLAEALEILDGAPNPAAVASERAALELTLGVCALSLDRPDEARARLESARDAFTRLEGESSTGAQRARNYLARLED